MADISIQFHALREELLPFVQNIVDDYNLYIVAQRFFPYGAIEVTFDNLADVMTESSPYERLIFTINKPKTTAKWDSQFHDDNPNYLRLDLGKITEKGLHESWLVTRTFDPEIFKVWKKIASRLKAMTHAGVTSISRKTGASGFARSHRYTDGAKKLDMQGILILAVGEGSVFKLNNNIGKNEPKKEL